MRSQSSAANLRKVHARKEEQKDSDQAFTPTPGVHHGMDTETPSPTNYLPPGHDLTNSVQKKHNAIMGKMFPGGIDESRKEHDYARKVFEEEQGHTAQPRGQHHHHQHPESHPHPHQDAGQQHHIKREQVEERVLDSQSPNDGDVDMDSDRSENSAQGHNASHHGRPMPQEPNQNGVQASAPTTVPSSTADTTQTLQIEPTPQAA